jgi:hypothetical protein
MTVSRKIRKGGKMQDITINKSELLEYLEENRDKHHQVFTAALEGYREELIKRLERRVGQLKAGKIPDLNLGLVTPADHTKDYDRVIMMVKMHTGNSFMLDETSFGWYVMDDWQWKRQFLTTSNIYAAAEVTKAYGDIDEG